MRSVDGLEASVGVVSFDDLDIDDVAPKVVAAAQAMGRRLG